jgi:undecaprenyl-diphosphatase
MHLTAIGGFVFDIFKLALYVACGYLALRAYARRVQSPWLKILTNKRFAVLTLLTLLVVGVKVFEDVITRDSGPIDTAILWFVRQNVPPGLHGFFSAVTWTGAAIFLVPASVLVCGVLWLKQQRLEAVFMAATMACGWALSYALKAVVARPRPELWSTTWYWGSSFPSGHTLSTAAFSTALTLIAARIWPASRRVGLPLAVLWVSLMGLSRMVLGVHWPSDVLAAVCLGIFLPLAISMVIDLYQRPPSKS